MKTLIRLLHEHPFFAGMSDDLIRFLAGCAAPAHRQPGDYLFREGDPARHFYLIADGLVAIEAHVPQSGSIQVETVGCGQVLGWSWMVPPHRWQFDGKVVEPLQALQFRADCILPKMEENHELGYQLFRRFATTFSQRLAATRMQLIDLYGKSESNGW